MPVILPTRLPAIVLLCCAGLLAHGTARAQSCEFVSLPSSLSLGTISSAGASTSGTATFLCRQSDQTAPRTFTVCLFMNPSAYTPGVAPRTLLNAGQPPYPHVVNYDLYADPNHIQILGSESSGHAVYYTTVQVAAAGPANGYNPVAYGTFAVYAFLPPGQAVASGNYVSQIGPRLHWESRSGAGNPPLPAECAVGPVQNQYLELIAQGTTGCDVGIATDLDFGTVSSLAGGHDQTSTIQIYCPVGTTWRVGLDNGTHAVGGQRRMAGSTGTAFVQYELYSDTARTQRWGNTPGTDTNDGSGTGNVQQLTVYGRVPAAQPVAPAPGRYTDTITVTLTF